MTTTTSTKAKFVSAFLGTNLGAPDQLAIAKMFKQAIIITLIATVMTGLAGIHGYDLGGYFVAFFCGSYGYLAAKWLQTEEGMLAIDHRMTPDRSHEVLVSKHWNLFTYAIVTGVILVLLVPMLYLQNAFGVCVSAILLITTPAACWYRNRKAI